MRFFGSGTSQWTQISYEGTIFDAEHDDLKIFQIFKNFGKSRNQFWDSPLSSEVTAEQIQIELKSILNETRLNLVNENGKISFHSARVILQRKG